MPEVEIDRVQAERIARGKDAPEALKKQRSRAVMIRRPPPDRDEVPGQDEVLVGFYDYDANQSSVALVDARTEQVLRVEKVPAQFQLSEAERHEAEVLAAADQRVQAFLHGRPLNPLTRLYFPQYVPPDIRHHRFAIVFVRPSNRERNYAVIDLSTTTVVAILTQRDLTGSRTG